MPHRPRVSGFAPLSRASFRYRSKLRAVVALCRWTVTPFVTGGAETVAIALGIAGSLRGKVSCSCTINSAFVNIKCLKLPFI